MEFGPSWKKIQFEKISKINEKQDNAPIFKKIY